MLEIYNRISCCTTQSCNLIIGINHVYCIQHTLFQEMLLPYFAVYYTHFFHSKNDFGSPVRVIYRNTKFGIFFINFGRSRKPITNLILSQKHIDSHLDQGFLFLVCFVMICLVKIIPNSIIYSILNPKCEIFESILLMRYIVAEYPPFLGLGTRGLNILLFQDWAPGVTNDTNRCSFC